MVEQETYRVDVLTRVSATDAAPSRVPSPSSANTSIAASPRPSDVAETRHGKRWARSPSHRAARPVLTHGMDIRRGAAAGPWAAPHGEYFNRGPPPLRARR
ncbi:hypothetical protein [Streptomyces taklimakanensis]|uniref:hypothetical protein n=1 Tax=Streptomyces taklimakanensis TaxID=2569853 RepID=UPI001EE43B84|nr:hypothetical protein [Streptomyces taklimakanensis]